MAEDIDMKDLDRERETQRANEGGGGGKKQISMTTDPMTKAFSLSMGQTLILQESVTTNHQHQKFQTQDVTQVI